MNLSLALARTMGIARASDFSDEWAELVEVESQDDLRQCAQEREACEVQAPHRTTLPTNLAYPIIDRTERAANVCYPSGPRKLTLYPRNDLRKAEIVIALHQAGVERSESRWHNSVHRVTCHSAIGPTGVRYRLFPFNVRLVSTNRVDRKPYACIALEFLGNFERIDGAENWYKPEKFGFGRAGEDQILAGRAEVTAIVMLLRMAGYEVHAILPHIVTGRARNGRPNRQACCGSRVWSEVGEWAGAHLGLAVPDDGFALGGLPVPPQWHGDHWDQCVRRLAA